MTRRPACAQTCVLGLALAIAGPAWAQDDAGAASSTDGTTATTANGQSDGGVADPSLSVSLSGDDTESGANRALSLTPADESHPFASAAISSDADISTISVKFLVGADQGHIEIDDLRGMTIARSDDYELKLSGSIPASDAQALVREMTFQRTGSKYATVTLELTVSVEADDGTGGTTEVSSGGTHRVTFPVLQEDPLAAGCADFISWKSGDKPRVTKRYRTYRVVRGPEGLDNVTFGPVFTGDPARCLSDDFAGVKSKGSDEACDNKPPAAGLEACVRRPDDLEVEVHFSTSSTRPDLDSAPTTRGGLGPYNDHTAMPIRFASAWAYANDKPDTDLDATEIADVYVHTRMTWTDDKGNGHYVWLRYEHMKVKEVEDAPVFELTAASRLSAFGFTKMYCPDLMGRSGSASDTSTTDQQSHCLDDPAGHVWATEYSAAPLSLHGRFVFSERVPFLGWGLDLATGVLSDTDLSSGSSVESNASGWSPIQVTTGPDFRFNIVNQPMHLVPYAGWLAASVNGTTTVRFTTGISILTELSTLFKTDSRSSVDDSNSGGSSGSGGDSSSTGSGSTGRGSTGDGSGSGSEDETKSDGGTN